MNRTARLYAAALHPHIDLAEREDHFRLLVELPGARADEVTVDLTEGVLELAATIVPRPRGAADGDAGDRAEDGPADVDATADPLLPDELISGDAPDAPAVDDLHEDLEHDLHDDEVEAVPGAPRLPEHRLSWRARVDFGDLLAGDDLSAVYQDGALLVTLPKAEPGPAGETAGVDEDLDELADDDLDLDLDDGDLDEFDDETFGLDDGPRDGP